MALSLITDIPATCYTSQLQQLDIILLEDTKVTLTIIHQSQVVVSGSNGQAVIFQATYKTGNGNERNSNITIYDIGSVIETFLMNYAGVGKFIFRFSNDTDSSDYISWIVYCKQIPTIPAADLVDGFFLTNYPTRTVYRGTEDKLQCIDIHSLNNQTTTINYSALVKKADGSLETYSANRPIGLNVGIITIFTGYNNIRGLFMYLIPINADILSYTITYGSRKAQFIVAQQSVVRQFVFRNAYGCIEYIALPTARTEKTETKSSTAVCKGELMRYDITHTRIFEEQTPVLRNDDVRRFLEFLTSYYTAVTIDGTDYPVIINNYDVKLSDNPGEGNTVKFEWQFAALRPPLFKKPFIELALNQITNMSS